MTDADFTAWEGEIFESQFREWLEHNQEILRRIAKAIGKSIAKIIDGIKDACTALWENFRIAVASAADAIRRLIDVWDQAPLPAFGISGSPPRQHQGKRRPPPVRDFGSTAVQGPHTFKRF